MFVARRPFLHKGTKYLPGDVITSFPDDFGYRPETFLHTGLVVEKADPPKRTRKKMEEVKAE